MNEIEVIKSNDIQESGYQKEDTQVSENDTQVSENDTQVSENKENKIYNKMSTQQVFRFSYNEKQPGQKWVNRGVAIPCSMSKFEALIDSDEVKTICDQIALLSEGYWSKSQAERDAIDEKKKVYKNQLPFISVHSQRFGDDDKCKNHRCNEQAVDNGCGMLDLDHIPNPREIWNKIDKTQIADNGILFASITPSGFGLRVIAERKENETIIECQHRLAALFGVNIDTDEYDKGVHDPARISYVSPRDYVLWINPKKICFQSEEEAQEAENRHYDVPTRATSKAPVTATNGQGAPLKPIKNPLKEGDCTPLNPIKNPLKEGDCTPLNPIKNQLKKEDVQSDNQGNSSFNGPLYGFNGNENIALDGGEKNASTDELVYTVKGLDIPYSLIVEELVDILRRESDLGELKRGNRHNYHVALCNHMRSICDNDPETLLKVVPNLMDEDTESKDLRTTAYSVCENFKLPLGKTQYLKRAIREAKRKVAAGYKPFSPVEDLPIPRLPRLLQLATSHLSDPEYIAATIILSLPVLGAEATGVRFRYYYKGTPHAFSFTNMVVGRSGIGKSTPYDIAELLATPMAQQSAIALRQENEYREDIRTASSLERKKKNPNISNRFFSGSITEAALLSELQKSRRKHLLVMTDELDTLCGEDASLKPGNGIWQKMYDNHKFGKYCKSADASNGAAEVLCNIVSATQTLLLGNFFSLRDVIKGAALRCGFAYLSRRHKQEIEPFTPEEEAEMIATAQALINLPQGTMMERKDYDWLDNALREWVDDKMCDYEIGDMDEAGGRIMDRLPLIMQRAGYLYSLLFAPELQNCQTDEEREQIKQDCINLMFWTGEYIYRVQYFLFAKDLLKQHEMEQDLNAAREGLQKQASHKSADWYPAILTKLPDTFTQQDFFRAAGIDENDKDAVRRARMKLSRYKGKGDSKKIFIKDNEDGTYSKYDPDMMKYEAIKAS